MMYAVNKYKDNPYDFPDHFVDPELKLKPEWNISFCEAIYSAYLRDMCTLQYSKRNDMINNFMYAIGKNSSDKYMDYLCPADPVTHKRKGLMNISWETIALMPIFIRSIIGMVEEVDYDIVPSAIDPKSDDARDTAKYTAYAITRLKPLLKKLESLGAAAPQSPVGFDAETMEELELMLSIGGVKMKKEISFQKVLKQCFYESNWKEIIPRIYVDFFANGVACVRDYVDPHTRRVKAKYINPINTMVRYSDDPRLKEGVDFVAVAVPYTIAELRPVAGLTEDELKGLARTYQDYNLENWNYNFSSGYSNMYNEVKNFDNMLIPVMEAEYFTWNRNYEERKKNRHGADRVYERDREYVEKKGKGKDIRETDLCMPYSCKWIIGTPHAFGYGPEHDIPRSTPSQPELSFHFWKFNEKSHVESAIPFIDNFHLNWYELQNATNSAAPAGLAVNVSTLKNIAIGEKSMSPLDIMTVRKRTGDLLYKAQTHSSQIPSGAAPPVTELEGGVGRYRDELIANMEYNLQNIRNITGINEIATGTNPDPEQPVGTSKIAFNQTLQSLKWLVVGYRGIKESVAKNFYYRLKVLTMHEDYQAYVPALGGSNMEVIKIGKELSAMELGFMLEMSATEEQKQILRQAALNAMRPLKQGGSGLTMADFGFIEHCIGVNQIKYAWAYLNYKENKMKQIEANQVQIDSKMNADAQQQSLVLKEQQTRMTEKAKSEALAYLEEIKATLEKEKLELQHIHKLEELQAAGSENKDLTEMKLRSQERIAELKMSLERMKLHQESKEKDSDKKGGEKKTSKKSSK